MERKNLGVIARLRRSRSGSSSKLATLNGTINVVNYLNREIPTRDFKEIGESRTRENGKGRKSHDCIFCKKLSQKKKIKLVLPHILQ